MVNVCRVHCDLMNKDDFEALLEPLVRALTAVDVAAADGGAQAQAAAPFDGELVLRAKEAAFSAVDSDWLLPKEAGGIRYGRVARDLHGFSVDAVLMSGPGPRHRHPNGEIDLCWARSGVPEFDGHPEGWVVYGPDSAHVPTVAGGEMLILYFLPGGAIEFL